MKPRRLIKIQKKKSIYIDCWRLLSNNHTRRLTRRNINKTEKKNCIIMYQKMIIIHSL